MHFQNCNVHMYFPSTEINEPQTRIQYRSRRSVGIWLADQPGFYEQCTIPSNDRLNFNLSKNEFYQHSWI